MTLLDRVLQRPLTWRVVWMLAVALHVAYVLAPFDVLHPVDAHALGRAVLEGEVPYRDFALEYPPGAIFAFLLPGLAPSGIAPQVLALQAVVCEVLTWLVLRDEAPRRRFVLFSLFLFPLLSGGFDAVAMLGVAASTALLGRNDDRGWWIAAAGAAVKIFPGIAWAWMTRWGRTGVVALLVTLVVLAAPLALGSGRDVYIGYHVERGVQQESLAASAHHLAARLTGDEVDIEYRFRAQEVVGAETTGTVALVVFGALAVVMAVRIRLRPVDLDPWLLALAFMLVVLCGSKVLSPQFIVLALPLAVGAGGAWAVAYLPIAMLSMAAFLDKTKGTQFMDVVLVRNVLFLGMAVAAAHRVLTAPSSSRDDAVAAPARASG